MQDLQTIPCTPTILIVDDDVNIRRLFHRFLSRESYRLAEAENGEQALQMLAQDDYDLIITDLQMQGLDGLHILNAAREKDPLLQVLIVTGYGSVSTAVQAMKTGAFDYLTKPVQSDALLIKVRSALEQRRIRHLLIAQQNKLDQQHHLILQDLELARQVQASLAPAAFANDRVDVRVSHRPMLSIGGDFAYIYPDDRDGLYLAVVDVTGHGIAAALIVSRVYGELRLLVRQGLSPRQILYKLNRFFMESFTEISLFLTMICIRCDLAHRKLIWSGSAHPDGLLIPAGPEPVTNLASQNRIIGYDWAGENDFVEQTLSYNAGDRLLLYTDGLIETENNRDEPLSLHGLEKMALQLLQSPAAAAADLLIQKVVAYGSDDPRDDLLLLIADLL
jgi:phosphoserine phosphatase RsbU/P